MQQTKPVKLSQADLAKMALALVIGFALATSPALAQSAGPGTGGTDVLGVQPISNDVYFTIKILAGVLIAVGFVIIATGRWAIAGLAAMAVGVLGVAKTSTIATLLGL